METFGIRVRTARKRKGLTLQILSKRLGVVIGYLSGIENGKKAPPAEKVVRRMARILGLELEELMLLAWLSKVPKEVRRTLEAELVKRERLRGNT